MISLRKSILVLFVLGALFCTGVLAMGLLAPEKLHSLFTTAGHLLVGNKVSKPAPGGLPAPPELIDPVLVQIDKNTRTNGVRDFDNVGCEGRIYLINIPDGKDALITADAGLGPIKYPVWITGGRNVHVRGLELRPIVQPGCDVGEAHQMNDERLNIHPRLVSAKAFRLQQSGTTYIEGVDIDLQGMEADCFVSRNPDDMQPAEAFKKRHIVIVNTRCTGIEGLDKSPVGDGIHGDFFQNQGRDDIASLVLENVTYLSSANGITLHNWHQNEGQPALFSMTNVNYGWDERYDDDDLYEISGLAFTGHASKVLLENVWLDHGKQLNYGILNGQRTGVVAQSNKIIKHAGLKAGKPATGDFAPANETGLEYVSPFVTP